MSFAWFAYLPTRAASGPPLLACAGVRERGEPAGVFCAWPASGEPPVPVARRIDARVVDAAGPAATVSLVLAPPGTRLPFDDLAVQQARRAALAGPWPRVLSTLVEGDSLFAGALTAHAGVSPPTPSRGSSKRGRCPSRPASWPPASRRLPGPWSSATAEPTRGSRSLRPAAAPRVTPGAAARLRLHVRRHAATGVRGRARAGAPAEFARRGRRGRARDRGHDDVAAEVDATAGSTSSTSTDRDRRVLTAGPGGRPALAALVVRLAAGVTSRLRRRQLHGHAAEAAAFVRYGVPLADVMTYAVGALELGGGVLLAAGLLTRPVALALAGNFCVAVATAGRIEGGPVHLVVAPSLLVCMAFLVAVGPGRAASPPAADPAAAPREAP